jgi:hypothetical protein
MNEKIKSGEKVLAVLGSPDKKTVISGGHLTPLGWLDKKLTDYLRRIKHEQSQRNQV